MQPQSSTYTEHTTTQDVHITTTHTHKQIKTTYHSESENDLVSDDDNEGDDMFFDATDYYDNHVHTKPTLQLQGITIIGRRMEGKVFL